MKTERKPSQFPGGLTPEAKEAGALIGAEER
jgi:hypothetical protein